MHRNPLRPHLTALLSGAVLTLLLPAALPAQASVTLPDCPAMAAWAGGYDKNAKWQPNALGSRHWFPALFAAPETTALFGKPVLDWTPAEAGQIAKALAVCEKALSKEKRYHERNAVYEVKSWASRNVANYLEKSAAARTGFDQAFAALAEAEPSPGLLAFYSGMAQIGAGRDGYNRAQQAAARLTGEMQKTAQTALSAARDLPQAELQERIGPAAAARADDQRGAVRARIEADIAGLPGTGDGLAALAAMRNTLTRDYASVFPAADMGALTKAIAERETQIGTQIADAIIADMDSAPNEMPTLTTIKKHLDAPLRMLPAAQASRIETAAQAKARKVGEAMLPAFRKNLADLPVEDAALDNLDGPTLAYVRESFGAFPALRPPFAQEVAARRAEIVAALDEAEAGPLRGRRYADRDGMMKMEFLDRTRVFITTPDGQTAAGTYTEEKDGRVVIALPDASPVLTRTGRRLTGGPFDLRRVD